MWLSSLFSGVGADRSSASRKRRGTRLNSRRDRFRPQIEPLEDRLAPALLIVGSLTDAAVDLTDATVTLRDAIHAANNDLQVSPGGPAGSGSDEIQFQSGLTGTIPLSQGELPITSNLTITGPGAGNLTISGNSLSRIFNVDDAVLGPTIDVEIIGLTLTGGNTLGSGGAIASFENLTVTDAVITGNSAKVEGGGIYNDGGTVTITGSTLSDNSAGNISDTDNGGGHSDTGGGGGAIFNSGTVTLISAILSGNSTGVFGDGGGILNFGVGAVTLTNSILSGNSAEFGGGIITFEDGSVTITNSTLSGNSAAGDGGGIFNSFNSTIELNNTIVANSSSGGQIVNDNGNVGALTGSNNLIEGESPVGLVGTITADPKLGPLQNNGGLTRTHRLVLGSPAIDAGSNALVPGGVTTDQRGPGFDRVVDGDDNGTATVDIGAFEFHSPAEQVEDLDELIDDLVADGSLNQGQGNDLTKKKENALKKIENGQINAAINELNAFVNQVEAFVSAGILSVDEGDALLDAANALLASITL